MKNIFILIAFTFSLNASSQSLPNFHDYGWKTIYQDTINFYQYYGKKVMIVNTASFCGYTYQFGELEQLYTQYQDSNFVILVFLAIILVIRILTMILQLMFFVPATLMLLFK